MPDTSNAIDRHLPWVEKYRPSSLDDLISHKDIIGTIQRFIKEDKLPHLLFYGPAGTGKTSTILAVAQQIYSKKEFSSMVLELNASDDRGIGIVREQILTFASTRTIFKSKFKLVILDEADAMTNDAQNALRRVMEKYTENTRFCLICNYLTGIIPAIQSRCTRFRFGPLETEQMKARLEHVIRSENVNVTPDGLSSIIRLARGDMRRSLNILQFVYLFIEMYMPVKYSKNPHKRATAFKNLQPKILQIPINKCTSLAFDVINEENVYTCTGQPLRSEIKCIVDWMLNENFTTAFNNINKMKNLKGLALQDMLTEVHSYVHRIEFPPHIKITLLQKMAEVEYRLSSGTSEKIQLSSLIAAFQAVRDFVVAEAD